MIMCSTSPSKKVLNSFVSSDEEELDDINFMTHGMNSIYIILDLLFVTGVPVRLYHLIHPLIAGVVYLVFTVIYDVAGGNSFHVMTLRILLKISSCFSFLGPLKLSLPIFQI